MPDKEKIIEKLNGLSLEKFPALLSYPQSTIVNAILDLLDKKYVDTFDQAIVNLEVSLRELDQLATGE